MEKLCSGGLASSMKDVGKTVKSFPTKHVFTTLLLMLLCMLIPQKGWAAFQYETTTYDFLTAANTEGNIIMSETQYSDITEAFYGATMTYGNNTVDISKFAFKSGYSNGGWWLRGNNSGGEGLKPQKEDGLEFAICDLHAGDIVTITYSNTLSYARGAHIYNADSPGGVTSITSGTPYTVAQDGDLVLTCNNMYIYIQTITIQELTSVATYSITSNVNSNGVKENKFEFTGEGRLMDTHISIPFLDVEFGSNLNATFVRSIGEGKYGSYIPDENGYWHTWFGEKAPYQGTFYKFKPTADGKLQVKGYLESGTVHLFEVVNEEAGYYESKGTSSGTGYVTVVNGQWVDLKKGKTYYICEQPNDGSTDYNNFQLHWFQFNNYFDVPELGKVLENGATGGELVTVKTNGLPGGELTDWSVKRTSPNIKNKEENSNLQVTCTNGVVSISGIEYKDKNKDKAGVMILDLNFSGGDATFVVTIPYSAEKGHKWNFYDTRDASNPGNGYLEIGRYKDTGSLLQIETDKREWKYTYRVINNQGVGTHDPMYQNVYDMEGNNANKIWETEGLWFDTPPYKSCLYNEIDVDYQQGYTKNDKTWSGQGYTDRYVGILPGGSFTIPGLKKNDRVLIEMGSGDGSSDEVCFLNITNARDAVGKPINSSDIYKAGGSVWNGINKDYKLRGYYHFIAAADGDMTFTMNDGSMTKLYTIEIYQGDHKYTDDATRVSVNYDGVNYNANAYQLLNDYKSDAKNAAYQLHYRGKGDGLRNPTVIYKTGNVGTGTDKLWYQTVSSGGSTNHYILFKSAKGEFGMFRMRIDVMEQGNNYVADYGLQNISVGYLDKKDYPYTWDFTDLSSYSNSRIAGVIAASTAYNQKVTASTKYDDTSDANDADGDMSEFMNRVSPNEATYFNAVELWKEYSDEYGTGYGLHVRNNHYDRDQTKHEGSGELMFTPGTQLFAGDSFIAEAAGLGLIAKGSESKRNGRLRITEDGLYLYEQKDEYWKVRIPEVPSTSAVYVRAKEIPGRSENVILTVGDANTATYAKKIGEDEWVYAVKGTGADMDLLVANVIVEKIAVSEDAKKVNSKGWTSESRSRNIDASLTAYMTGKDIKTYLVSNPDYKNRTLTLTDVGADASNYVLPANTGCVMYNATDNAAANILDGGFHLFVPDMHDQTGKTSELDNLLVANVDAEPLTLGMFDGSDVNYVLAYKYQLLKEDGTPYGDVIDGPEMFYRVSNKGIKLHKNSAYLKLPKDEVMPSENNTTGSAKFTFIFADELENDSQATGIEEISVLDESSVSDRSVWYNLNGQKLNGKPQQRGLYIVNGKKVLVK